MSLRQKPCTVFIMKYSNHILIIALKQGEILIKTTSTQYNAIIIIIIINNNIMYNSINARSLDHTSQMFCQLDILKIYDLIDFNTCIFMHKVFHN